MKDNPIPQRPELNTKKVNGILFLKNPSGIKDPVKWYFSKIAGVPLVLRNLLTMERIGINEIAIYLEGSQGDSEKSFEPILKDTRLSKNITWIRNIAQFKQWAISNRKQVYILNGLALHDKKKLSQLIKSNQQTGNNPDENFSSNPDDIETFLLDNEHYPLMHTSRDPQLGYPIFVSGSEEETIKKNGDFKSLQKRLVKGSGLNHDSSITRICSRPASQFLTSLFLKTPISPNQITLFSFTLGFISALLFLKGEYSTNIIAGMFLVLSTWVDGADGEIARLKFMETDIGKKLDIYCDNIIHFLIFVAIGFGVCQTTGNILYLYIGGLAGIGGLLAFFLLSPLLIEKRTPESQLHSLNDQGLAEKFANRDFIHFLFLVSVINQLEIFISLAAIGTNIFVAYLIYPRFFKPKSS